MTFNFHQSFQNIMRNYANVLSGYEVTGKPEARAHIQVDYFCKARFDKPYKGMVKGIRPLKLCPYNVFELEGLGKTFNEGRLRYHLGRTLVVENPNHKKHRRGQTGLTIIAVRKPAKLLNKKRYEFKEITPWKYETRYMDELPITIIILRELQTINGGEALALLQLLEPSPKRRARTWRRILDQELTGKTNLKSIMMDMDEEVYMTIADELREEGREEGMEKGALQAFQALLDEGLISKEVFQQRAALLVQKKKRKPA